MDQRERAAKLARAGGQRFDCATWLHKARSLPKEEFRREVEKELTGRETEPDEIIYFNVYKSQIPVVRVGTRDRGSDAWERQIARVLPGDDLRRLSSWGEPGYRESGH